MPGDGTKLDTTQHNPPARLLDLTRLVSRAGGIPTGVDRVELAYLMRLLDEPVPFFALVRTTLGYALLDRGGAQGVTDRVIGQERWGEADRLSWIARKKGDAVRRAESDLRRLAVSRCVPSRLGQMLQAHLPRGTHYLNTGHSNLNDRTLWAMRHDLGARIGVFVHDMIPLDFPQFQRPGTPETFRAKMQRARHFADLLIFNSRYTEQRTAAHMSPWGPVPEGIVAPLGVDLAEPDPDSLPVGLPPDRPYFVTLGTIEPRKNHALMLDVWESLIADFGPSAPMLLICGSRGWNNEAVFRRLDALPPDGAVRELSGLSDGALRVLLQGAQALIFPSAAEGYGLPAVEAAALGTPLICSDLPVFREVLGDIPVYLKETDRYLLRNLVESLSKRPGTEQTEPRAQAFRPPTWENHFRLVLEQI